MMTLKEFLSKLKLAHDVPNRYSNKFPYNLGYFDGIRYSFDCWNLVKVVLSGWNANGKVGDYVHTNQLVTGDVDGKTLLGYCTNKSKDFSKISIPGTYLYLSTDPHAGVYLGEFQSEGRTYNVVECTKNMFTGQDGVVWSWVDPDGTRRPYKGSTSNKGRWTDYGLLTKYVSYDGYDIPIEHPVLKRGSKGPDVVYLQQKLVEFGYDPKGIDGQFGPGCEAAVKQFQKDNGLAVDGVVGPATWAVIDGKNKTVSSKSISAPVEARKNDAVYYTVKSGDTLSNIAKKQKVKLSTILELNPDIKDPNKIYVGQKIRIK